MGSAQAVLTLRAMTRIGWCAATLAVFSLVAGCSSPDAGPPPDPSPGRFAATYEPATTDGNRVEEKLLRDNRVLEDFAESMTAYVRLPRDVRVVGKECGEANAFYLPDEHEIHYCYELSAAERVLFAKDGTAGEALDGEVYNSAVGTLYHEAGHALIGELDLKITGREEDVADQLAAYVLTSDDEFKDILLTVANSYRLSADEVTNLDELPFYDTHSLDPQRSVNFLCYLYGSDQKRFEQLVTDGALPAARAESCGEEYTKLVAGWESLLAPHVK